MTGPALTRADLLRDLATRDGNKDLRHAPFGSGDYSWGNRIEPERRFCRAFSKLGTRAEPPIMISDMSLVILVSPVLVLALKYI